MVFKTSDFIETILAGNWPVFSCHYPGNLTGWQLTSDLKEIETSGFLQDDRLDERLFPHQEEN